MTIEDYLGIYAVWLKIKFKIQKKPIFNMFSEDSLKLFEKLEKIGLTNKKLKENLKNSPKNTNLQMIIALFLLDNKFELEKLETKYKGKPRDIIVKEPFTIIEIINMKDEEKFRDTNPLEVVDLGRINIQRIWERILEKSLELKNVSPNILIFGLSPGTEKDEFDDVVYENKEEFPDNIDMIIGWRNKKPEFYIVNPNKKISKKSLVEWFKNNP